MSPGPPQKCSRFLSVILPRDAPALIQLEPVPVGNVEAKEQVFKRTPSGIGTLVDAAGASAHLARDDESVMATLFPRVL